MDLSKVMSKKCDFSSMSGKHALCINGKTVVTY